MNKSDNKRIAKGAVIVAAAVLLLFIAVVLLVRSLSSGGKTLNMTDYMSARFSGLSGEGSVSLDFDQEAVVAKISETRQLSQRDKEELQTLLDGAEKDFVISKEKAIANGDEIEVTGAFDKKLLKAYGYKISNDTVKIKAEGMPEKIEIPVDDYILQNEGGFDGYGNVNLRVDYEALSQAAKAQIEQLETYDATQESEVYACLETISIEPSNFTNVSAGDTIEASVSMEKTQLDQYGITFTVADYSAKAEEIAPAETLNLADYLTVKTDGFDGYGQAYVALDEEKLKDDLAGIFKKDNRGAAGILRDNADIEAEAATAAASVYACWSGNFRTELDRYDSLHNGDTVTITSQSYALLNAQQESEAAAQEEASDAATAEPAAEQTEAETLSLLEAAAREDEAAEAATEEAAEAVTEGAGGSAAGREQKTGDVYNQPVGIYLNGGEVAVTIEDLPEMKELRISDYLSVSFEGFEGEYSSAAVERDFDRFREDISALAREQDPSLGEDFVMSYTDEYLYDCSVELPGSGLYNGDPYTAAVTPGTQDLPYYGIHFTAEDLNGEVSGLAPVLEISLEDYETLEFRGFDGSGTVSAFLDTDALTEGIYERFLENHRDQYGMLPGLEETAVAEDKEDTEAVTKGAEDSEAVTESADAAEEAVTESADAEAPEPQIDTQALREAAEDAAQTVSWYWNNYCEVSFDKETELSNGDTITIQGIIPEDSGYSPALDIGLTVTEFEKTFEVSGLAPVLTVSLTDFAEAGFSGFDGSGTADIWLNTEAMQQEVLTQFVENGRNLYGAADTGSMSEDELSELSDEAWDAVNEIDWCWRNEGSFDLDRSEGLSNGDTVTGSGGFGDAGKQRSIENYGLVADFSEEKTFEVAGLTPVLTIPLTDYMVTEISGFDGAGTVQAWIDTETMQADILAQFKEKGRDFYGSRDTQNLTQEEEEELADAAWNAVNEISWYWDYNGSFVIDPAEGLHNEDMVTVSGIFNENESQAVFEDYGLVVTLPEKELTVSGLEKTIEIAIEDYIDVSFSGYDGIGSAGYEFKETRLVRDLNRLFKTYDRGQYPGSGGQSDYRAAATEAGAIIADRLAGQYTVTLSDWDGLSNDDTLTLTGTFADDSTEDERLWGDIGILVKPFSKELTVSGLTVPESVDLADAVKITFSGVCPEVTVNREVNYELPYIYETSLPNVLSSEQVYAQNGDVLEETVDYYADNMLAMGYAVTGDTCTETVSGLDTYLLDLQSADDTVLNRYLQKCLMDTKSLLETDAASLQDTAQAEGTVQWNLVSANIEDVRYATVYGAPYVPEEGETMYVIPGAENWSSAWCKNRLYVKVGINLPVRDVYTQTMKESRQYAICQLSNIRMTPSGVLRSDEEWTLSRFASAEEAEAYIAQSTLDDLGEECTVQALGAPEETGTGSDAAAAAKSEEEDLKSTYETAGAAAQEGILAASSYTLPQPQAQEASPQAASLSAASLTYGGHTYYRFDMMQDKWLTWQEAKTFCEQAGGHLATVTSAEENAVIRYLLQEAPGDCYWLGGTDEEYEGVWKWVTGEAFDWTNWDSGEPNNKRSDDENGQQALAADNGYDVWYDLHNAWDGNGFILEMEPAGETQPLPAELAVRESLAALYPVYQDSTETCQQVQDPYGNMHFNSIRMNAGNRAVLDYRLNGKYTALSLNMSTWTDVDSEALMNMMIWGDDRLLFSTYSYQKTEQPVPMLLDVSGVQTLSIQTRTWNDIGGDLFLNEAYLYGPEEAQASGGLSVSLYDLPVTEMVSAESWLGAGMPLDPFSAVRRSMYQLYAYEQGRLAFNLDGEYDTFNVGISAASLPDNAGEWVEVSILGDSEELWKERLSIADGVQNVQLDVTGVSSLQISTRTDEENGYGQYVDVMDGYVTGTRQTAVSTALLGDLEFPELAEDLAPMAADYITCGNVRYYRIDEPVTYFEASRMCARSGGRLASPQTEGQQEAYNKLMERSLGGGYWTGTSEAGDGQAGFVLELDAVSGRVPDAAVGLGSLEWTDSRSATAESITFSGSRSYEPGDITISSQDKGYFRVQLGGGYRALAGTIGYKNGSDVNAQAQLAVFGDGKLLYKCAALSMANTGISFMADVTGVQTLTIAAANERNTGNINLILRQPILFPGQAQGAPKVSRLQTAAKIDETGTAYDQTLFADSYGYLHDGFLSMDAAAGSYMLLNANGSLTAFTGKWQAGAETDPAGVQVSVWLDNEAVYESGVITPGMMPVPFEIDLTGKSVMRIETQSVNPEAGVNRVYLVDDQMQ